MEIDTPQDNRVFVYPVFRFSRLLPSTPFYISAYYRLNYSPLLFLDLALPYTHSRLTLPLEMGRNSRF